MARKVPYRFYLSEDQMPTQWYNLRSDMKEKPEPMINPATMKPVTADDLNPIFCEELVKQELDEETRYVDIPEEIQEYYKVFRPSPLIRAYNLEKALDTPAKIYFKFEGNNTSGSHKLNSAIAQAYYAKEQGITHLTTETGAGQWGTALSEACAYYGIDLTVYMVKSSYQQKPFRKSIMNVFDAQVIPSPSITTKVGQQILELNPNTSGSLGCAISEAVEHATSTENCRYSLGSALNQVLLHQSIIGLESKKAMEILDEYPDVVIGCAGGGSNLGGLIAPFIQDKLLGKTNPRIVAVEPASCPTFTRGKFAYDFCDTGKVTPLAKMYTLGGDFIPSADHSGGLRFHGMNPILSKLYHDGLMEAISVTQTKVFEAAIHFAKLESILPAPESAHAIYSAVEEAKKCKETGEAKTILFGLTGTGYFDLTAYESYLDKTMADNIPTDEDLKKGFDNLPQIPGN